MIGLHCLGGSGFSSRSVSLASAPKSTEVDNANKRISVKFNSNDTLFRLLNYFSPVPLKPHPSSAVAVIDVILRGG